MGASLVPPHLVLAVLQRGMNMGKDWHRTELIRACSTLVSEGLMDMSGLKVALAAYDERKELQDTLDLVLDHERRDEAVSIDEAYSSVMTGIPISLQTDEDQES